MTAILLEFPFAFGGLQTFTCLAEWAKPFDDQKANSTCCVDSEKLMSGETPDLFFCGETLLGLFYESVAAE